MTDKKTFSAKKRLTTLAVLIITVAFLISLAWEFFVNTPYYGYKDGFSIRKSLTGSVYYEQEYGEYRHSVFFPTFLNNDGYLRIEWGDNTTKVDEKGNDIPNDKPYIALFIYPSVFKETKYMLHITFSNGSDSSYTSSSVITFTIDNNGKYIINHSFEDDVEINYFNEYEDVIVGALKSAEDVWDLGGWNSVVKGKQCK